MTEVYTRNWIVRKAMYPVSPSRVAAPLSDSDEVPPIIEVVRQTELIWTGGVGAGTWPDLDEVIDGISFCRRQFGTSPDVLVAGFPRMGDTLCGVEVR